MSSTEELQRLERSMERMDQMNDDEVDADEYASVLARIVELRALLSTLPPKGTT